MRLAPKARSGAGRREAPTRSGAAGVAVGNRTDLGAYFVSEGFFSTGSRTGDGMARTIDAGNIEATPLNAVRGAAGLIASGNLPIPARSMAAVLVEGENDFAAGRRQCATRSAEWRGAEHLHAKNGSRSADAAIPQSGKARRRLAEPSAIEPRRRRSPAGSHQPDTTLRHPIPPVRGSVRPLREAAERPTVSGQPVQQEPCGTVTALLPHPGRAPRWRPMPRGIRAARSWWPCRRDRDGAFTAGCRGRQRGFFGSRLSSSILPV